MHDPPDLFDRVPEWEALTSFGAASNAGVALGIVRGRRRQGKSFLLRRLVEALSGFYYQALEEERVPALAGFGAALGMHLGVPGGVLMSATPLVFGA